MFAVSRAQKRRSAKKGDYHKEHEEKSGKKIIAESQKLSLDLGSTEFVLRDLRCDKFPFAFILFTLN
jgi:hypothetical protein